MALNPMNAVLQRLRRAVSPPESSPRTDAELLADYARGQAEAFEVLVRRHGAMVLGVCRRILGNDHDAEDAFQATFFVLARKAGAAGWHDSIANWLHGVALRTARNARLSAERRQRREEVVATMIREPVAPDVAAFELKPILDEEVSRLPEKYRQPVVLCYLEGQTNEEAARQLRCPTGTLKVHLMQARDQLRSRLAQRGLSVSAVALATLLDSLATAATVPESLLGNTLNAAERFAAGSAAAATPAAALAEGVLREMFLLKLKTIALAFAAVLAVGIGLGLSVSRAEKPAPATAAKDDAPAPVLVKAARKAIPAEDAAALVKGNSQFAFDLYAKLLEEKEGNVFFSPYSISTALGMTYAGARGDTATEMAKALSFTLPQDKLHPASGAMIDQFNAVDGKPRGYKLGVANALWGQQGFPFQPAFLQLNRDDYGAGLNLLDFGDSEAARLTINKWVEDRTQEKIKDLIPPRIITRNTRLVLTNAIYFKGDWARQFVKDKTREADFHVTANKKVTARLMHQEGSFRIAEVDKVQVLELPYVGNELSMLVFLPNKVDGLADLEKRLKPEFVNGCIAKLVKEDDVHVRLPKFKTLMDAELCTPMKKLGMRKAFDDADFSGITAHDRIHISAILHKAFVDVNEEGTEAAAATAVVVGKKGVPNVTLFRADHPFIYLIRDNKSGSILFMGRLVDPS